MNFIQPSLFFSSSIFHVRYLWAVIVYLLSYGYQLMTRSFNTSIPVDEYSSQWSDPSDVFSVLLLLGGDVVNRALAQLAGTGFTPVAFSFGWVAYAVSALVSSVGENKLMPEPDCAGLVINGELGNKRENTSWIIGRLIRDFGHWSPKAVKRRLEEIIDEKHEDFQKSDPSAKRPKQAGLCISVFEASDRHPAGRPHVKWFSIQGDWLHKSGIIVSMIQLGIAAIPLGVSGDWGVLMLTGFGIVLSYAFGTLPQWRDEKWACRRNTKKSVVLTRGNGAQHAIVIIGKGRGLDLEDLATVAANVDVLASLWTRFATGIFTILWVLLLITAAGTQYNSWFLLAVGGLGILHNAAVAGWQRRPKDFGTPLKFVEVIADKKVMRALVKLEERYPHVGYNIREVFFQGTMFPQEKDEWEVLAAEAEYYDAIQKEIKNTHEANDAEKVLTEAQNAQKGTGPRPKGTWPPDLDKLQENARKAGTKAQKAADLSEKLKNAAIDARGRYCTKYTTTWTNKWASYDAPVDREAIYT